MPVEVRWRCRLHEGLGLSGRLLQRRRELLPLRQVLLPQAYAEPEGVQQREQLPRQSDSLRVLPQQRQDVFCGGVLLRLERLMDKRRGNVRNTSRTRAWPGAEWRGIALESDPSLVGCLP